MAETVSTEQALKRHLDGKFFRLASDGSVTTITVDRDFVPDHIGNGRAQAALVIDGEEIEDAPPVPLRTPYSDVEDRKIIALKLVSASTDTIARALGRGYGSVCARMDNLKKRGRL